MQYMSQATGLADCILLAMAPLGIITTIVSAIRVGGPTWLKAVVGRARENLSAAEIELMSSTSKEACELWNGRNVIRCQGSARIWQFICLVQDPVHTDPQADDIDEIEKITIIRDNDLEAPNLSLNCHNRASRVEIYLMAVIGTLLQIGVLVFFGFITYYRPIQSHFLKDNNPVANYAFPCAALGTIALVIGMFLCAFVIERSTTETFYAPTSGNQAWIVWLQKNHVVNDQVFQPYAIYPASGRTFITTSRRSPELDKQKHDKFKYLGLEALTFVGTAISLIGFIVQFIGLRGLNWSASVVQLGAVILMTCARTWVRRGLAEPPISSRLTSDFELDWLALSLKDLAKRESTGHWKKTLENLVTRSQPHKKSW
ncbi:hypothetical protein F4809DRAFT_653140 [Biscogniauxia mediterranea]|nr:hypothetical protein F4809DRAFT_653140 [Biscogniauxia mediterranea]